jgi:microcystin-dependent protein
MNKINLIGRGTGLLLAGLLAAPMAQASGDPFLGEIVCGGWNFEPTGWAFADGRLLPISQNTALFSLLGTQYGGNGTSNFALPDLRGRAMVNAGQGPGLSNYVQGQATGLEAQQLSAANLPVHSHLVTRGGSSQDASQQSPAGNVPAAKARSTLYAGATPGANLAAGQTDATGQGQSVSNMQPFVTLNCVIALQGVFPPRQ